MIHDHDQGTATMRPPDKPDYGLTGGKADRANEMSLAEADRYERPVLRATMSKLLEGRDVPVPARGLSDGTRPPYG